MKVLSSFTTVEFTINAGTGARVRLDPCPVGVPYVVIDDGPTEVTIKPADDETNPSAIAFAGELVGVAVLYAMELRTVSLPLAPHPLDDTLVNPSGAGMMSRSSSTTFEFTINAGRGARVHLDACCMGMPYIVIEDGPVGMIIKPADDETNRSAIAFADELVEVARGYEAGLVEALTRSA